MTPTLNSKLSDADLCRVNGWSPFDVLEGDERTGRGPERITITAVGKNAILAIGPSGYEQSWTLKHREWKKVEESK